MSLEIKLIQVLPTETELSLLNSISNKEVDEFSLSVIPIGYETYIKRYYKYNSGNVQLILCVYKDVSGCRKNIILSKDSNLTITNAFLSVIGFGLCKGVKNA